MSPADCFRLFLLCLWLLDGDVNCENTHKGYVLRVQAGQATMGVHNDNQDYKRWSEPPSFRIPTAGHKTSSVDGGQRGNIYRAQETHTTDSKSSQIQNLYPVIPETQNRNVPKSQVSHFRSVFNSASVPQGRSTVVSNRSGNKAFAFPDGTKIHQANSYSALSTGVVQVPPRIYRARTKPTGRFSPVPDEKAPVSFGPNNRKSLLFSHANIQAIKSSLIFESQKIHVNPSRDPKKTGHFESNSAGEVDTQMSYPAWSPRAYGGGVMSEAKGYTHARRLKPAADKTRPQASSAAGKKVLDTGFPSGKQNQGSYNHDSTKLGFGLGVPASSHIYNSRGRQPSSWHPPPPDRSQIPVQGKFKPFQRLPVNDDLPALIHSSDNDTTATQTSAETTLPPSLNSTGNTSSVVSSVDGELSTEFASPMQTKGRDADLVPQASNHEGKQKLDLPLNIIDHLQVLIQSNQQEKMEKNDTVVLSPLENEQSKV